MGLRNATVRRLAVPDLTTTVLTLTLTGIAADSALAGGRNPRLGRRLAAVLSIFVGSAIGAALVARGGLATACGHWCVYLARHPRLRRTSSVQGSVKRDASMREGEEHLASPCDIRATKAQKSATNCGDQCREGVDN